MQHNLVSGGSFIFSMIVVWTSLQRRLLENWLIANCHARLNCSKQLLNLHSVRWRKLFTPGALKIHRMTHCKPLLQQRITTSEQKFKRCLRTERQWQTTCRNWATPVGNHMESNVSLCGSEMTWKIKQLMELGSRGGTRDPVPHSWQRQ